VTLAGEGWWAAAGGGAFDEFGEEALEVGGGDAEALGDLPEEGVLGLVVFSVGHGDLEAGADDHFGALWIEVAPHLREEVGEGLSGGLDAGDLCAEISLGERTSGDVLVDVLDDGNFPVVDDSVGEEHADHDFPCSGLEVGFDGFGLGFRLLIEDLKVVGGLAALALDEFAEVIEGDEGDEVEGEKSPDALVAVGVGPGAAGAVEFAFGLGFIDAAGAEEDHVGFFGGRSGDGVSTRFPGGANNPIGRTEK
jgi:hypothetical protein